MYAFHLTLHELRPVKDVPPINETSIKSAGRVCDSKQKTTYLFPPSTGDVVKTTTVTTTKTTTSTTKPNTGPENQTVLSPLPVRLSFEVLAIQHLMLSKYIHLICGLYNNS